MRKWMTGILMLAALGAFADPAEDLFTQAKSEGDLQKQIALLTQVISLSPQHVGAYHYRADAYQALGKSREALLDYNKVVSLRPKDPFRYYARGLAYQTAGEYSPALADFTKAISLKPSYANFYLARARAYRSLGKYAAALADYKKYAGSWQQAPVSILHEVIPVSLEAYLYPQAQEQIAALESQGDDSASRYFWQGRVLYNENKWDEAVCAFSKAINRDDEFVQAYQWRANAFKEMKEYEPALEDYTQALVLFPQAYWYNRRGLAYEELKDFEKASADYSRAIALDPSWAVAYNNRGFAKLNTKDYASALEDFKTAVKLDPTIPTPYVNLAGAYWLWKKDRKHMYENLQKALNHNFKNYEALFDDEQKGWMFKGVNQTAEFRSFLYK